MDLNRKKLIQLRTKLKFYRKLDSKLQKVLNDELDVQDWSEDVYLKILRLEAEIVDLKVELDLSDNEWYEDED
jgi:hypothetical protein